MDVPALRPRDTDAHKGTCGRAMLIGGSRGMTGAICLSAHAALKSGAGLVTAAVPDRCLETVAAFDPCFMTIPLEDNATGVFSAEAGASAMAATDRTTSVGIGPGMSRGGGVTEVVRQVYSQYPGPLVADADALNALAGMPDVIGSATADRILTPHIGEFRRLVEEPERTPKDCRDSAVRFAQENNVVVVLKGPRTLVTDGTKHYENTTGNPGMATGGAGDVLTGVITALLGQGYSTIEATVLAVHVHGLAGDIARDQFGEISMTAMEIVECLPDAFQELAS